MIEDVEEDSKLYEYNCYGEDAHTVINSSTLPSTNNDYVLDVSCDPESMEMDRTYNQNMKTLLMFSYGKEPKGLTSNNSYNSCGSSNTDSALSRFKSILEECAVAG